MKRFFWFWMVLVLGLSMSKVVFALSQPLTSADYTVEVFATGFSGPTSLAFGPDGNLYVANNLNGTVSRVGPQGGSATFFVAVSNASTGFYGGIYGLTFDPEGNIYVSYGRNDGLSPVAAGITRITLDADATPLNISGIDLSVPEGLATGLDGNPIIANSLSQKSVVRIYRSSGLLTAIPSAYNGRDNSSLLFDSTGNLYENGNDGNLYRITLSGIITQLASGLGNARDMALDSKGNLYVTSIDQQTVYMIKNGATEAVPLITNFSEPFGAWGIVIDSLERIYVSDYSANVVWRFSPSAIIVSIDIKPGSFPNSINLNSNGVVPVAVLTTDTFDATTIDVGTIVFAGAPIVNSNFDDVNGDGRLDMVCFFKTQKLNLDTSSTSAILTGKTMNGRKIEGVDSVRIVPGKK